MSYNPNNPYGQSGHGGYSQRPQLPCDPERINQNNYTNQLPRIRPSFPPPLEPHVPFLVQELARLFMDRAGDNPLRVFAFNLYGDRQFNNREFESLVSVYCVFVDAEARRRQTNPDQVIQESVEAFVEGAVSMLTRRFPDITMFLPPEAKPSIDASIEWWLNSVEGTVRRENRASYGGGNGGSGTYGGGGGGGNYRSGGFNSGMGTSAEPMRHASAPSTGGFGSFGQGGFSHDRPANPPAPVDKPRGVYVPGSTPEKAPAPAPAPAAPTRSTGHSTADHMVLQDGTILEPAFKSHHRIEYGPFNPPSAYVRDTHMHFVTIRPDGSVEESVVEKSSDMAYLDHELDLKLRQAYKANQSHLSREPMGVEVDPIRRMVPEKTGRVAMVMSKEKREELAAADAPTSLGRSIMAPSLDGGLYEARLEILRDGKEATDFMEFVLEQVEDYDFTAKAMTQVLALKRDCRTLTKFRDELKARHADGLLTDDLLTKLDERMALRINRFIGVRMFIATTITSFLEDWDALSEYIQSKWGETVVSRLEEAGPELIDDTCSCLHGKHLTQFLANAPDDLKETLDEPVVFSHIYAVTQVPWTMYEMASAWRLSGVVTAATAKPLYDAIEAIVARTHRNKVNEWRLYTADRQTLYVYRSGLVPSNFLVTTEAPRPLIQPDTTTL